MIHLTKTAAPAVLLENAVKWTETLLQNLALGVKPSDTAKGKYRHPQIKAALVSETYGKCAYCESKLRHIHHGDIEHIFPKSIAPEMHFEWSNLTLACEICNQNKSDNDPNINFILDPYIDYPEVHLIFAGAYVFSLASAKGTNSIRLLDLNRVGLLEVRLEKVERIMGLISSILAPGLSPAARRAIHNDLINNEADVNSSYSAMVKCLIASMSNVLPDSLFE